METDTTQNESAEMREDTEELSCREEAAEAEAAEKAAEPGPKKLAREVLELKKKLAEAEEALAAAREAEAALADKHLRLAAEYDNFRRRAAAERSAAYTEGLEGALSGLLPVLDNLERAALYTDGERVAEGLAMIAKAAREALASLGVETFGEAGDSFDPGLHNAVMHIEDGERGEGEVAEVHQKGYKKGERILRYAMVTVAN